MTRRISKHGTTYAEGSSAALGKYPKVCFADCGRPLRVSVGLEPLWFENVKGELRSWHFGCRPTFSEAVAVPDHLRSTASGRLRKRAGG